LKNILSVFLFSSMILLSIQGNVIARSKSEDVVYLKNGSVIHGTIVELIPNQSVKIQTADHNVFIFKMDEVEKITKASTEYYKKSDRGYVNCPDIGYLPGVGDGTLSANGQTINAKNEYHAISIRDVIGFRINQDFIVGGGIGYEYFGGDTNYMPATEYIPIFFNMRAYFASSTSTQAGFVLDLGYDIGLTNKTTIDNSLGYGSTVTISDKYKGGLFLNPAICLRTALSQKTAFCFSIGYEYQSFTIEETGTLNINLFGTSYSQKLIQNVTFHSSFLTLRAGLEF
jgi:hypothetical protein